MSRDHRLRCQSFVLRTRGDWSDTALARLNTLLKTRGTAGSTDHTLTALTSALSEDAVYVCVGSACARKDLASVPSSDGLPVRHTACLGPCRLSPSAHRVVGGRGQTYSQLDKNLLHELIEGAENQALEQRAWRVGEMYLSPEFAPLLPLLAHWRGPGGFRTPKGCQRSLSVVPALGGAFLELRFENAWPTVVDRPDRFSERVLIRPDSTGPDGPAYTGYFFDYSGKMAAVQASLEPSALVLREPGRHHHRHVLAWTDDGRLSERREKRNGADGGWSVGLCAELERVDTPDPGVLQ